MDSNFKERYFNSLLNDTCLFCGKGLIYNRDFTGSCCQDLKCQYNESIDFGNILYAKEECRKYSWRMG